MKDEKVERATGLKPWARPEKRVENVKGAPIYKQNLKNSKYKLRERPHYRDHGSRANTHFKAKKEKKYKGAANDA